MEVGDEVGQLGSDTTSGLHLFPFHSALDVSPAHQWTRTADCILHTILARHKASSREDHRDSSRSGSLLCAAGYEADRLERLADASGRAGCRRHTVDERQHRWPSTGHGRQTYPR